MLDKRLLRLVRAERATLAMLIVTIGLGVAGTILVIAQARTLSGIIDGAFLGRQSLAGVGALLAVLLAISVARGAASWAGEVAARRMSRRVRLRLRADFFAHLLALGPAFVRRERSGELANTAFAGVEELEDYYSQYLPQVMLCVLAPLAILGVVFPLDALTGLVLLLTAPLIPLFMALIGSLSARLTQRQWATLSRMSGHFLDVLQGLTTLKLFGRSQRQAEVIARISDDFRDATLKVLRVAFLSSLALEIVATISTAVVAVEVGLRLLYGTISFGQAFFILLLAPEFYLPLRQLGTKYHAAMSGKAAAQRIFDVLRTPAPASAAADEPVPLPAGNTLRFADVRYAYDDDERESERPALDGLSFTIPAGQHVALVGPSGAGKSTLFQVLLRFVEPQSGAIYVDDVPLGSTPARAWRERIAWVPQQPYLFNETVAANIRLARPDAPMEQVIRAAQAAHAHEFIQALPQGYDTVIGERGARLSGGQAQRIALARAFLRDAPILLLDEPTAHLDAENEALVQESIARLMRGRTVLTIAHRLDTIRDADQILVIDQGRLVGSGTHSSLLAGNTLYQRLVESYGAAPCEAIA